MGTTKDIQSIKSSKKVSITCIVPMWNEEKRVEAVLDVLITIPFLDEILVINDGSSDDSAAVVSKYIKAKDVASKLRLIDLEVNVGKSDAVRKGMQEAKGSLIAMIDADLKGLTEDHIVKLVHPVISGEYDLTILDLEDLYADILGGWYSALATRFVGGQRAYWKDEFEQIPFKGGDRYNIEVLMNLHYVANNKHSKTVFVQGLTTTSPLEKAPMFTEIKRYTKMTLNVLKEAKLKGMVAQLMGIEYDLLHGVYEKHFARREGYKKRTGKKAVLTVWSVPIVIGGLLFSIFLFARQLGRHIIRR